MKTSWRDKVDKVLRSHLEAQINATSHFKNAYHAAKNSGNAQLWIAIAGLSKQIYDLNLRMDYLERAFRDTISKPQEQPHSEILEEKKETKKRAKKEK